MSSYNKNFYFKTEQQIPTEHYIEMQRINMEKTTDSSGNINLYDMSSASWVDYNVEIVEAGEYNVFFRVASEFTDESVIYISVNGDELTSMSLDNKVAGEWNTQQGKITLQSGKQKIRLGFKKGGLKLNWWAISKNEQAPTGIATIIDKDINIFPNPVEDILNIQSEFPVNAILANVQGQQILSVKDIKSIDMSDYPKGMYLLKIQFPDGKIKTEKIIKK